jgi:hypothetical protein
MRTAFKLPSLATLFLLAGSVLGAGFEATWNPNPPSQNVVFYTLHIKRGASVESFQVPDGETRYRWPGPAAPGETLEVYVTATSNAGLESAPSATVLWWEPSPPPAINVTKVRAQGFSGTNWNNLRVDWSRIDLAAYRASNYVLTASSTNRPGQTVITTNVFHVFASLPIGSYTFAVHAQNSAGTSPAGQTIGVSHVPPGPPPAPTLTAPIAAARAVPVTR